MTEINTDLYESYIAHFGVKGMRWGVRRADKRAAKIHKLRMKKKTIADKYRPVGTDKRGRAIVKRRGILGFGRPSKVLNVRKTQKLIDQIGLDINYKKAARDKFTRKRLTEKVLDEMAAYKYTDIEFRQ